MTETLQDLRASVVEASQVLFANGVMSHAGHANLSARVDAHTMLLTTGGHVRHLTPSDLALVRTDGTVLEGELHAVNAEIVHMHGEVYRAKKDVGGIIHTHSPALLGFAVANRPLRCTYEAMARFGQDTEVPVVPWAPRGSERSVGGIVEAITKHPQTQAVLLGNHGVLVFTGTVLRAAMLLSALEEAAEAELAAEGLGGARELPTGASADIQGAIAAAK